MQVCPQDAAGYARAGMEHMVMIVPVDPDVNEAEDVAHEHRGQRREHTQAVAVRNLQLEHHDRDDDCDHAIAECFEPVLAHIRGTAPVSSLPPQLEPQTAGEEWEAPRPLNSPPLKHRSTCSPR